MRYVSVAELRAEKDIADDADDDILGNIIDGVTAAIETYTGRVFDANVNATRYYDWSAVDGLILWLDADLAELESITNGDDSGTAIAVGDVTLLPRNEGPPYQQIRLDADSTSTWQVDTDYWIQVEGKWGWSTTPPADIKRACLRWCLYMYAQRDAQVFETTAIFGQGVILVPKGIPTDVKTLLDPYRRLL